MQITATRTENLVRTFMARTYSWMAAGLALTAGVAYLTAQNEGLASQVMALRFPLIIAQLVLVFVLAGLAQRLPSAVAGLLFIAYAALTGLTFSALLFVYSPAAVTAAFLTTAGTFGAMSVVGFVIKRDLSALGRFFLFALIGLLIAMIVNIFVASSVLTLGISVIGVLLFAGLTAYDTQMLRNLALSGISGEMAERAAINGALALYLDFINMFLFILRLFGIGGGLSSSSD
ncbi:Bax inhibitor-1/YccA family protein [Deinococcus planocerae]|uniref:Bax inhibitor-1/YccA family protein n=1 Tax=Deinococcus planocerae TaxID=1737569 RepID=UPI0015E1528C|nr:Bax inhibitor-1/YccA family protein [Deinococcus planocerae]